MIGDITLRSGSMESLRSLVTRLTLTTVILLSMGCAGSGLTLKPLPVTANPSEQIEALAHRVDQASEAKIDVLSPTWFGKASDSLREARATRDDGGAVQQILSLVAAGNAQLDTAQKFATRSQNVLPSVIEAREAARTAGAMSLGEAYTEKENQFIALTRAVETDDISWAEKRSGQTARDFRQLELQAIKQSVDGQIRQLISQARKAGAERLVPRTLAETMQLSAELDAFITKNRYASDEIGARAKKALFQANRLLHLTQHAASLAKMSREDLALADEALIAALAKELALPPLGDRSFADQQSIAVSAVGELRGDRDLLVTQTESLRKQSTTLNQRIADLEGQTTVEQGRVARLEADRRMNDLYTEVSAEFTKQDAEVYRQGQNLVIRLRGIQFPVGGYVLEPASYALLAKVQKAIRAFGQPSVVVEGHTDTTGSAGVNDHLSEQRAKAVATYLVANNTLPGDRVTAVGKGFSEPIASNNTQSGRALNRRIDVIIDGAAAKSSLPAVSSGGSGN